MGTERERESERKKKQRDAFLSSHLMAWISSGCHRVGEVSANSHKNKPWEVDLKDQDLRIICDII